MNVLSLTMAASSNSSAGKVFFMCLEDYEHGFVCEVLWFILHVSGNMFMLTREAYIITQKMII